MCKYMSFKYLLTKRDFYYTVDHLALIYIMKNKTDLGSARINRLLKVLSTYSFHLYHMKGKDMTLSNFLSRIKVDKSIPHEVIPISFDLQEILQEKYYNQTGSGPQEAGITVGKIHGHNKSLLPNLKLEKAAKYYISYLLVLLI